MFYEIEMLQDLLKIAPATGVAVDVGANIGNHSLFFAGICNLKTYAFEPFANSRKILQENILINDLTEKITIIDCALGSKSYDAYISSENTHNSGTAKIKHDTSEKNTTVQQLDSYKLTNVSLVKIDVEGMELDVLKGSVKTIAKSNPIMLIEAQTITDYNTIKTFLEILDYIPINKYNDTPTILFLHKSIVCEKIPFLLSNNNLYNTNSIFNTAFQKLSKFI